MTPIDTTPVKVQTHLGNSAGTAALKAGRIHSPLVEFEFSDFKVAHDGFKPMVREERFDAGELAIVTFLQAKASGQPLVLLPAVLLGRFQHHCIASNERAGSLGPKDIEGRRVGVRSYTQTTGVWVRGILQHEYGVDLERVTWCCKEDSHVPYQDPPTCERLPPGGNSLAKMLTDGDLEVAILGNEMPADPRVRPLLGDPKAAAAAWFEKHGVVPINHVFVVREALSRKRPDVVAEIFRLLLESRSAAPQAAGGIDLLPFGVERNRKALALVIEYAWEQRIIARRLDVDELFDDTTRTLGA